MKDLRGKRELTGPKELTDLKDPTDLSPVTDLQEALTREVMIREVKEDSDLRDRDAPVTDPADLTAVRVEDPVTAREADVLSVAAREADPEPADLLAATREADVLSAAAREAEDPSAAAREADPEQAEQKLLPSLRKQEEASTRRRIVIVRIAEIQGMTMKNADAIVTVLQEDSSSLLPRKLKNLRMISR